MTLEFEILCIDQKGKVPFSTEKSFIQALSYNESLWEGDIKQLERGHNFFEEKKGIEILIQKLDTSNVVNDLFASAFILTFKGNYDVLEPLRLDLLKHIRQLGFNHLRILKDDVSIDISIQIYPLLNKLENLLRRYVVKFFTTKIGLNWWDIDIIVPSEVREKAKLRLKNEKVFTATSIINADVGLIDFNELGEIIYQQKTAFSKVEDLVKKIDSATSLEDLRSEVQGNYSKYFKDYFEQQEFQKRWKRCFEIRNKVAHNYLFVKEDLEDAKELTESLTNIIVNADEKIDEAFFSIAEKEALKTATEAAERISPQLATSELIDSVLIDNENEKLKLDNQQNNLLYRQPKNYKIISEEEVISQLTQCEAEQFKDGFVGLRYFVTEVLGSQGYSYSPSYAIINILADKGKLEIYDVKNPYGDMPTKAIKIKDK
jgi:uncharacterized protein with HEPN domain